MKHQASSWQDRMHPDDVKASLDNFRRHSEDPNHPFDLIVRHRHKDGHTIWVRCRGVAIRDESGNPIRMLGVQTNLTPQEEAVQKLKDSEDHYRELADSLPEVVLETDLDARVTYANRQGLKQFGYSAEDLEVGLSAFDTIAHEDRERAAEDLARVFEGEQIGGIEYTALRKDGSTFPMLLHINRVNQNGKPVGVRGIAVDITERKRAVDALRQSEDTYRNLLGNLNAGVVVHAPDTSILIANHAACDLLGLSEDQLFGREASDPYWKFLRDDGSDMPMDEYPVNQVLSSNEPLRDQVVGVRRSQAQDVVWLLVNGFSVVSDSGEREQVIITFVDITARKLTEISLEEAFSGVVLALSRVSQERDPYTTGHQQRVTELAVTIAQELGLPAETQEGIRIASLIHDIGKISIPMEILVKPTEPSPIEWQMIQSHASRGASLLEGIKFPWPIQEIILQHHERLDGSGYPRGLTGDQICAEAQVIAVADLVEAMSSHRPYRPALGVDVALEALRQDRGAKLDPDTVDACLRLFETGKFAFSDKQTDF